MGNDIVDPRLKPLELGYGEGLSEFVLAIDRVILQKKDIDWAALTPAQFDTESTYYTGIGQFRYWIEGLGHDVDEDELIWWTPMSQRIGKK